jgi:hypothetical protein
MSLGRLRVLELAGAFCILAAPAHAGDQTSEARGPPAVRTAPPLQFERVAATGESLRRADPRFRVAHPRFRFNGGVAMRSANPMLRRLRWFDGSTSSGPLANGQVLVLWPSLFAQTLPEVRIAEKAELAGQETNWAGPGRPAAAHPRIPGYRYITSVSVGGEYIGLWRSRTAEDTLLVAFTASRTAPYRRIGHLPLTLDSLVVSGTLHGIMWSITLTGVSRRDGSLYILGYEWMPRALG